MFSRKQGNLQTAHADDPGNDNFPRLRKSKRLRAMRTLCRRFREIVRHYECSGFSESLRPRAEWRTFVIAGAEKMPHPGLPRWIWGPLHFQIATLNSDAR